MFKHILCPVDGSKAAQQALDVAARLAQEQRAALTICSIVDPSQAAAMAFGDPNMSAACYNALDDEATALLVEAAARVKPYVAPKTLTLVGQPTSGILDCASSSGADLIVMGSHGRNGISRALLGSVAEGVLRHAHVPVMIIRYDERLAKSVAPHAAAEPATA